MTTSRTNLGVEIASVRTKREMTQRQLAAAAGVHYVTVARIESAGTMPKLETLQAIANALRVPISRFVQQVRQQREAA